MQPTPAVLSQIPLFRRVSLQDRERIAGVAHLRAYERGGRVFDEGDASDHFVVVVSGRVKVFKRGPAGRDVILEIFGPGGPIGAIAAYEERPYPASAEAMEPVTCLLIPRPAFFALLEQCPSLVRGLLSSLSHRLVELTARLTDLTGHRIESRFARLFLKLADRMAVPHADGTFIPLPLARQDLADLTGTTIETTIRIMSRWNRDAIMRTEKAGFVLLDRAALEKVSGE